MSAARAILVLTAGASAIGAAWWWMQHQASASVQTVQPTDFIDQAKQAALTPPTSSPSSNRSSNAGALISTALGFLSSLTNTNSSSASGAETGLTGASYETGNGWGGIMPTANTGASASGVAPLLKVIKSGEANKGYNSIYSGSKVTPGGNVSGMTVQQVMDWQAQSVRAGSASSAAGAYQIILPTMKSLVSQGVLSPSDTFDSATQDRAAIALMHQRGLSQYQAGQISAADFANNLSKEWASLPVVTGANRGQSYYSGVGNNQARVSVPNVLRAINQTATTA